MPNPLVSVVITSYNRADYLREAVDSILNQSFTDYEVIIIDDGSTDNSPAIAEEYADKHENVIFIAQKNAGVAAARTEAVKKANGELIAFQDDDDMSHPDRLQRQVEILKNNPGMAACVTNFSLIGDEKFRGVASREKTKWMWQGHAHLIRRNAYLATGGYRPYFRMCSDVDFFLLFDEKYDYYYLDEVLYFYRHYSPGKGDNITNSPPLRNFPNAITAFYSAHCRRTGKPDPVEQNIPAEELQHHGGELPADMRLRLLHKARNAGRRLLARGEASKDNMRRIREYIDMLGHGECRDKAKKCRRWLMWQSLRYRQFSHIKLFW